MLKLLFNFCTIQQLAKIFTFSIFLTIVLLIWLILQNLSNRNVEIKPYKILQTSTFEDYEIYKRKLDKSPKILISKNKKIIFLFDCNSMTASICDHPLIELGNKLGIDYANIVTIQGNKYIHSLRVQNLTQNNIDYVVSYEQLALNYQNDNKDMPFIFFIIFLIPFTSILILCHTSLEQKIIKKLSNF